MGKVQRTFETQSEDTVRFIPIGRRGQKNQKSTYTLTYEFEDGDLISARLITLTSKSKGKKAKLYLVDSGTKGSRRFA